MKIAIVPEPSVVVLDTIERHAPDARIFAPWALGDLASMLAPKRLRRFVEARRLDRSAVTIPGWSVLELALRAWQRGRTDRRYRAAFALRRLVAQLFVSAWRLRWRSERISCVLAPSLAAREVFASIEARAVLLEDLPGLRQLHGDLEQASEAHASCVFLRRFRASPRDVVRQESEWVMADDVIVRGRFAAARHKGRVVPSVDRDATRSTSDEVESTGDEMGQGADVALAGLASARHGSCEALALLEAMPSLTLSICPGEGMEPTALLRHPRVRRHKRGDIGDARVVIAPSWVECYPAELVVAAARSRPIVATGRASGHIAKHAVREIMPGDVLGLVNAVRLAREQL